MAKFGEVVQGFDSLKAKIFEAHNVSEKEAAEINDKSQTIASEVKGFRKADKDLVYVGLHMTACPACEMEIETAQKLTTCPCCGNPL